MSLIRLVYTSESRIAEANRKAEIGRIVDSARELNLRNHITGFLLATPGAFAQVLEGDRHAVAETYGRIVVDPRHGEISIVLEEEVAGRAFSHWSMGLAKYDETTNFIFGLYGVSPESDLHQQPVESLLDLAGELSRQRA